MLLHTNFPLKTPVPKDFGILRLFLRHILHDGLSENDFHIVSILKSRRLKKIQLCLNFKLKYCSMLFEVAKVYNVPREGFNEILKIINNIIIPAAVDNPGMKVKSAYKSLKAMKAMHPVHFEKYDSCVNGCMMFPGDGGLVNTCRFCKKPRYQKSPPAGVVTPISHVSVGSISDIVAQRATNTDRLADIFDGSVYRKMVLGGYFDSPYKKHNLCQLMLIPGNNKPKDLDSFLAPILSELELLSRVGIKVATVDEGIISSKVHILTFVGDIPAVADLIKHSGHTSYHGCRMCVVKGVQ
ncbi:hypothetical protein [Absidia glauca]|uniref:Uncharacterized protein n=1 Tax=Absidia glauca TaxID=4829 RepID=A0A168L389_ABSGL|nr:hypothetical protein [Absidia glauca]